VLRPKSPKAKSEAHAQQKKGSAPKKDAQEGKKDTAPTQGEQGMGDTTTQETPSTTTPQETGPPKRPIIHTGGSRKKAKAHKKLPEYTITEDDTDLMEEKVQEHTTEEFEDAQHQRGEFKMSWQT
jgi:hypothetical protein